MTLQFSRRLALVIGMLLPIGETVRRWGSEVSFWSWFDDYLIGGFLLFAVWKSRQNLHEGQRYLAAAWAFACGLGYASFFGHLKRIDQPDSGNLPHVALTMIIGAGWALAIWALIISLKKMPANK